MKPPTDSQWEAVRACDEHVLVEAGAGTGKTFTVVHRILYLLGVEIRGERYHSPVTLDQIVAITFTRQAAADLKRDLRAALRDAGRRADAHAVDLARIGTIHSFCSELVREHALRRGSSPVSGVLEEGEGLAWAEGCVRDELVAALETRDIDGLDVLLAKWETSKVEQWTLRLMSAGVLPHLDVNAHTPEERALIVLARRARARMEARLEREGTIDYDRMIEWTRDLLRDETSVRALLQRRIHTLIIDEFQDTDAVQREIAYMLAEPASARADTPRLMLVGDPKQSIYRFRGADVTVWSGVRRDFEAHGYGRRLRLTDNFRSVPAILTVVEATAGSWLNTPVAGGGLQDFEVQFEAVDATRNDADEPAVEFLLIAADDDGKARNADDRRRMEAAVVARRLLELNRAGTPWRDMALLLRKWTSVDIYSGALRAAGVPVYALRDDDFLETREVLDLIVALQAIRDPRDDLAVFGFLRSPFVNLRDDTLLAIAVNVKRPYMRGLRDWRNDSQCELPEREHILRAIDLLDEFARLRDRVPAAALLDELLRRTGYLAHLACFGDRGAQATLNVRRFMQMIASMEENSVGVVLRAIAERRAREDRVPQARLHGEQDDVLVITSIHMAKGLDWPVVVYGDLGAGDKPNSEKLLVGRDRIALGEPDVETKDQPLHFQALRAAAALEEAAEEKRVAYVGVTRPKDRLILAGISQGSGVKGISADFVSAIPALANASPGDVIRVTSSTGGVCDALVHVATTRDITETDRQTELQPVPAHAASLPPRLVTSPIGLTRHSATELLAFTRCERRQAFKYVLGIREPKPDATGIGVNAIARGQIVHDVLEHYEDEERELEHLLEDAIGRWDEDAPPPESQPGRAFREDLREEIERVLNMPEYAALAQAPGARRELQFLHVLDDGAAMQGAIDIAAPGDAGLVLADVKTSRITAGQAAARAAEYAPQQDVYVAASAAISARPVQRFGFIFSAPGTSVSAPIETTDIAAATERVRAMVAHMGTMPADMTTNPRECFMCGYRKAGLCPGVRSTADVDSATEAVAQT